MPKKREDKRKLFNYLLGVMKVRSIRSNEDVDALVEAVTLSAERALSELAKSFAANHGLQALWAMKFQPVGRDPLNSELPLNLIEQVNQTFTYLASAKAVKLLLGLHPELAPFTLNLGTSPGSDIESSCGRLAAEVFAAVNTSNNQKLVRDRARVSQVNAEIKYVFFMCPGIQPGRQPQLERKRLAVPSVQAGPDSSSLLFLARMNHGIIETMARSYRSLAKQWFKAVGLLPAAQP
jgi:hypothetical protein